MAEYKILIPKILKWEAGFVNDPTDNGGATMKGVTMETYTFFRKLCNGTAPTITDLKLITDTEWELLFKKLYWDRWCGDQIKNQSVANILVDWVWGSGKWGIIIPQRILGLKEDGIVGPVTIAAVNKCNQIDFFNKIQTARSQFLFDIVKRDPKQRKFINGWLNRLHDYRFSF